MSASHKYTAKSGGLPAKRPRLDHQTKKLTAPVQRFTTANEIRTALRSDQDGLIKGLTALRNQLTVRPNEPPLSATDERLLLAQHWLENAPGAHDVFTLWDDAPPRPPALISLLVSLLATLLTLLSPHYTSHIHGHPILKTILTPPYLRKLNAYLGSTSGPGSSELILVTLKLWNAMSDFAGGKERKAVIDGFSWELKSLPKLMNMRRHAKPDEVALNPLHKPDIRTLLILFILSPLSPSSPSSLKSTFLTSHRLTLIALLKGLPLDPYPVVRKVLEILWGSVWEDVRVGRSIKVTAVGGENVFAQILKLYDRTSPESSSESGEDTDHIPADLAHHYLLATCTRPGVGICFKDRGWYPRETLDEFSAEPITKGRGKSNTTTKARGGTNKVEDEYEDLDPDEGSLREDGDEKGIKSKGKIYNKILSNVLKTLRVNEDGRQQELALRILRACPELVAGYWSSAPLTLEPRLSSKWITNISFIASVIALPVPSPSFLLSTNTPSTATALLYTPHPPPLSTILASILPPSTVPSLNPKVHWTKGLQAPAGLVRHCTAVALVRCLDKFEQVGRELARVSAELGEGEGEGEGGGEELDGRDGREEGLWAKRLRGVKREVRRRVPDFQVVLAFVQLHSQAPKEARAARAAKAAEEASSAEPPPQPAPVTNPTKEALLGEAAQRLMWMYQRCLPELVAEARFDVGKVLVGAFGIGAGAPGAEEGSEPEDVDMSGSEGEGEERDEGEDGEGSGEEDEDSGEDSEEGDDDDGEDEDGEGQEGNQEAAMEPAWRLNIVRQLHVLRFLKDSDGFVWTGKAVGSNNTYLHILLTALTHTPAARYPATRTALEDLLKHVLAQSILFQADGEESGLWLACLPFSVSPSAAVPRRAKGAEAPDGAQLEDEAAAVIAFLDDCIGRGVKTTYRYIEEMEGLLADDHVVAVADRADAYPSPLLMTVLEQLDAKLTHGLLTPSAVLALATFTRKLVSKLASKLQELRFLRVFVGKVDEVLRQERLFEAYPVISASVRREVGMMKRCLGYFEFAELPQTEEAGDARGFLEQVGGIPVPSSDKPRIVAAYELVDWLRLVDEPMGPLEVRGLVAAVDRFHRPALRDVLEYVDPGIQGALWDGVSVLERFNELREYLTFELLFIHSSDIQITDPACRDILTEVVFTSRPAFVDLKRVLRLIAHGLVASQGRDPLTHGLLLLLACIMKIAKTVVGPMEFDALKNQLFVRPGIVKDSCVLDVVPDPIREGLHELVDVSLDPLNVGDRQLVSDISAHWLDILKASLNSDDPQKIAPAFTWIRYIQPSDLFGLLDILAQSRMSPQASELLRAVLDAVRLSVASDSELESALRRRLPQLLVLRSDLTDSDILEEMIAIAIEASLPVCYDGAQLSAQGLEEETSIAALVRRAETRWSLHLDPLPAKIDVLQFLTKDTWSESTVKIISGLIYRRSFSQNTFISWLGSEDCSRRSPEHFVTVLRSFLETCRSLNAELLQVNLWVPHFTRLVKMVADERLSRARRKASSSCVSLILSLAPSNSSHLLALLVQQVENLPTTSLTAEILTVGARAPATADRGLLLTALADHGAQWAVRRFADDKEPPVDTIRELSLLVKAASGVKPHLVETLLGVVIQHQLANAAAIKLATDALSTVQLKPLIVNRHLQSVLQHPQFFKICAITGSSPSRDAIVGLLHVLFHLHPNNTCQVTHVEPLVQVYRGTLSTSDSKLLSIFQLFETQRKTSAASLLSRWSSTPNIPSSTSLDAVHSLEPILVLRTCLNFPKWRRLEEPSTEKANSLEAQLYDPVFLILLFAQMLAENPPASAFAWVELFRTNIVSLLIRTLSSRDGQIRDVALCQIVALWKHLETADVQEKPHVLYILNLLKDILPPPSEEPPRRLPAYTTLILLHSFRGIFYPSNFIYPITARFLLQRPELDTNDVPMLYNMLYSSTDDWKKERGWIIRFLSDGMTSSEDWRVFKRRHTWDLLASLFQSSENDHALRSGIFEILANLTCNTQATTSLILKSALLTWIEMQLLNLKEHEGIAWVKILENICTVVDPAKIEFSTDGEWRAGLCRCLILLLRNTKPSNTLTVFPFITPLILRISLLPGSRALELPMLLDQATDRLKLLEASTHIPHVLDENPRLKQSRPLPPHRSHGLYEPYPVDNPLQLWGDSVEALWRVTMTFEEKSAAWDALSSRLVIWRAIVGEEVSAVGEWVRTEVVQNIG